MAIRYYDNALVEKIKGWVRDPNLRVLTPSDASNAFQARADDKNDKPLKLPLISISRDPNITILSTNQKALTYDGARIAAVKEKSKLLNAVPISLSYQLDIYTRYFAEADEYFRNFIFNIINYPRLSISIPYNDSSIEHTSTLLVESTVTENSDIPEKLIPGQFTRLTIKLTVDDAWLFSVPFKDNWQIEVPELDLENIKKGED